LSGKLLHVITASRSSSGLWLGIGHTRGDPDSLNQSASQILKR